MPREHFVRPIRTADGPLVMGATSVRVLEPGTSDPIAETIYAAATGTDTRLNPWIVEEGVIDFYLDKGRVVDIGLVLPGTESEVIYRDLPVGDEEIYKETMTFTVSGSLTAKTYPGRFYLDDAYSLLSIRASIGVAPTGAAVIIDVNKNGSTLFPTQSERPTIAAGTNMVKVTPSGIAFAAEDYLTIDVDQVGSTTTGAELTVQLRMQRLA